MKGQVTEWEKYFQCIYVTKHLYLENMKNADNSIIKI